MLCNRCHHSKVNILAESAYCPDCGELIFNNWYICRCKCCGIKRKAILVFDNVVPDAKFCTNCGSDEFEIIKLENINFVNIHYAVIKREIVQQSSIFNFAPVQTWVAAYSMNKQMLFLCTGK